MRFDSTVGSIGIVSAIVLAFSGCGGSELLPVGGPFGEELNPGAVGDGGIIGDGNGVLPSTFTASAAIGGTPTWTEIYNTYFESSGTIGHCMNCHLGDVGGTASASALYVWLAASKQGQIGDNPPALVDPDSSCLTWMSSNGTMPYSGTTDNKTATADLMAWAKAGALNN